MSLRSTIREQVLILRDNVSSVPAVIAALKTAGAIRNANLRDNLNEEEIVEWYAGQILDVLESKSWSVVSSIIGVVDLFVPEIQK